MEFIEESIGEYDNIYANLTQPSPTWTDNRPDLVYDGTVSDLLAVNALMHNIHDTINADSGYAAAKRMRVN
jgi:hypothetical protein